MERPLLTAVDRYGTVGIIEVLEDWAKKQHECRVGCVSLCGLCGRYVGQLALLVWRFVALACGLVVRCVNGVLTARDDVASLD